MNDFKPKTLKFFKSLYEELKCMQETPKLYLSQYFSDLKAEVDTDFALKQDKKSDWLEIINSIESFETDTYKLHASSHTSNTLNEEIQKAEDSIEYYLDNLNLNYIFESIDKIKYKIERLIFGNKSIFYLKDTCIHSSYSGGSTANDEWGGEWTTEEKSFLCIINDEYLRKSTWLRGFQDFNDVLTKEALISSLLSQKLKKYIEENYNLNKMVNINVIKLNVDILNITKICDLSNQYRIKEIHPDAFNGFVNLEEIDFYMTNINKIHVNTFNGLLNLKSIAVRQGRISSFERLDPNVFKGLTKLEYIHFGGNFIPELHADTFKDLINLKQISFYGNSISRVDKYTFKGLIRLESIYLQFNKIQSEEIELYLEPSVKEVFFSPNKYDKNEIEKVKRVQE
jgi:hypothetical protein